jgi:hypothetical protein
MTAKAAWLDECGQKKFKVGSWETIWYRRLSIDRSRASQGGRVLLTTTPYTFGWLKSKIYDAWIASGRSHPEIDVFQFSSTMNPAFAVDEMERAQREIPKWRYEMMFLGKFTKPAGVIYEVFDEPPGRHKIPRFPIPLDWPRYLGLDFGGVNTAAVFLAKNPETQKLYLYREYHRGNLSAAEHTWNIRQGESGFEVCAGGSRSEGQWRREFGQGGETPMGHAEGLQLVGPVVKGMPGIQSEVEVGINRVVAAFQNDELFIFDDLPMILDELATYSRVLDDNMEPTEDIEDKETYHILDSLRYIMSHLRGGTTPRVIVVDTEAMEKAEQEERKAKEQASGMDERTRELLGLPTVEQEEYNRALEQEIKEGKKRADNYGIVLDDFGGYEQIGER